MERFHFVKSTKGLKKSLLYNKLYLKRDLREIHGTNRVNSFFDFFSNSSNKKDSAKEHEEASKNIQAVGKHSKSIDKEKINKKDDEKITTESYPTLPKFGTKAELTVIGLNSRSKMELKRKRILQYKSDRKSAMKLTPVFKFIPWLPNSQYKMTKLNDAIRAIELSVAESQGKLPELSNLLDNKLSGVKGSNPILEHEKKYIILFNALTKKIKSNENLKSNKNLSKIINFKSNSEDWKNYPLTDFNIKFNLIKRIQQLTRISISDYLATTTIFNASDIISYFSSILQERTATNRDIYARPRDFHGMNVRFIAKTQRQKRRIKYLESNQL